MHSEITTMHDAFMIYNTCHQYFDLQIQAKQVHNG